MPDNAELLSHLDAFKSGLTKVAADGNGSESATLQQSQQMGRREEEEGEGGVEEKQPSLRGDNVSRRPPALSLVAEEDVEPPIKTKPEATTTTNTDDAVGAESGLAKKGESPPVAQTAVPTASVVVPVDGTSLQKMLALGIY